MMDGSRRFVALYGWHLPDDVRDILSLVDEILDVFPIFPTNMFFKSTRDGKQRRRTVRNRATISTTLSKLETLSTIEIIETRIPENFRKTSSQITLMEAKNNRMARFVADPSRFSLACAQRTVEIFCRCHPVVYGFVHVAPSDAANYYPFGMHYCGFIDGKPDERGFIDWKQIGAIAKILRGENAEYSRSIVDIYELNILSAGHINRRIDGLHFVEWINKNQFGTVSEIGVQQIIWHVPESVRSSARSVLIANEMILAT